MSVTTTYVPRSKEGLDKCPECGHISTVMTDYYPADRVDPECSAGYCQCATPREEVRCVECNLDRCYDRGFDDPCECECHCGCRYEWG